MNVRLCMYERDRLSNCGIEDRKWKKRQTANLRLKGSEKESFKREQRGEMKANWYRKKKRKQRKTLEKLYFREFFHGSMRKGNIERERERERERCWCFNYERVFSLNIVNYRSDFFMSDILYVSFRFAFWGAR